VDRLLAEKIFRVLGNHSTPSRLVGAARAGGGRAVDAATNGTALATDVA
jgi:hypothetical protein